MNKILMKIEDKKHIEIVVQSEKLFVGSALYTYILTLHKKVSLVCKSTNIERKYSFIPWFEKIKKSDTPSADYSIELDISGENLYNYFENNFIKINSKMATALYGALLNESNGFQNSSKIGASFFNKIAQLIEYGADYKRCQKFIIEFQSLALLRLKSIMLNNMILVNNATTVLFYISENDLKKTGADLEDAKKVIREIFSLPYIENSILLDLDRENEVIIILNKEINFE